MTTWREWALGALLALGTGTAALAQSAADAVVRQLEEQGYVEFAVSRTLLGRIQVIAVAPDGTRREIVFNPSTGEILRDYQEAAGSGPAEPTIIDRSAEAPGAGAVSGDEDDDRPAGSAGDRPQGGGSDEAPRGGLGNGGRPSGDGDDDRPSDTPPGDRGPDRDDDPSRGGGRDDRPRGGPDDDDDAGSPDEDRGNDDPGRSDDEDHGRGGGEDKDEEDEGDDGEDDGDDD